MPNGRTLVSGSYFTLLVRDTKTSPWRIEYGAYTRNDVKDELSYYHHQYDIACCNLKIIKTDDKQDAINFAVTELNTATYISAPITKPSEHPEGECLPEFQIC